MKTVFTTGEAAKICKVSQQTIIRCFDNGQLKGFRVPGSRFRRIPREMLYKFMKDNGIPTDALESGKRKVLLVDDDVELVELMTKVLDNSMEDVRILCISGMIEEDKIQELKLAGADDFLHKPFDIEELIDRMCGMMEIESNTVATTA